MKQLLKTVIFVALLLSIVSCSKEDKENATVISSKNNDSETQNTSSIGQESTRGIDPSGTFNALELLYGDTYDFSNKVRAQAVTDDFSTVHMCVAPHIYDDYQWITIMLNNGANVIGIYEIDYQQSTNRFDYTKSENDSKGQAFTFYITDIETNTSMIYATASINVYALPDRLQIYNGVSIPTDYPYSWFNNITYGHYNLATYVSSSLSVPQKADIALRTAATLYNNFY